MTKANKPGSHKKEAKKNQIGGTAAPGAKSTQPKQVTSTDPQKQQTESYNRQMRRRMQQMGTGPYSEPPRSLAEQRKKRLDRKKKRLEAQKEEVRKIAAQGPRKIGLGRRNTYFLLGVVAILALIIVVALIINHPFW